MTGFFPISLRFGQERLAFSFSGVQEQFAFGRQDPTRWTGSTNKFFSFLENLGVK